MPSTHVPHFATAIALGLCLIANTTSALPAHAELEAPTPTSPWLQASERAEQADAPIEIPEATTETSTTTANPDGTYTTTISRSPQRIRKDGTWTAVDTTITSGSHGRLEPRASSLSMSFSSGGDRVLATTTQGSATLSLAVPFDLPTPTINGDTLIYPNVLPDVDLSLQAGVESYSETLIVKTPAAAANPALDKLAFTMHSAGAHLAVDHSGASEVTDDTGTPVFSSPAPMMWDSRPTTTGQHPDAHLPSDSPQPLTTTTSTPAHTSTRSRITGESPSEITTLHLTPPHDALSAQRTYPIYIDPGFSVARASFTVTRSALPSYANNTDFLRVGYCAWAGCTPYYRARSYMSFDISSLKPRAGANADIMRASLTLTQVHSAASAKTTVALHKSGAFTPKTTWPGPLGDALETATKSGTEPIYFSNTAFQNYLTSTIRSTSKTINFALKAPNENDSYQWKKFDNNAKLSLTYIYPPQTPTNLGIDNALHCGRNTYARTNRPTVSAKAHDHNNDGGQIAIAHELTNTTTKTRTTGKSVGASDATQKFTPAKALADGTYTYRARSAQTREGSDRYSAYTSPRAFQIDTTAPARPTVTSFTHPEQFPGIGTAWGNTVTKSSFMLTVPRETRIAGYAYSWTDSTPPVPHNATCQTAAAIGQYKGYITATNGTAGLNLPPTLPANNHTLTVRAIDDAGNLSAPTSYNFNVSPAGTDIAVVEAEKSPLTQHTADYGIEKSTQRSAGAQLIASPTTTGQGITVQLTIPKTGTWIIQPATAKSTNYATIGFAIDGKPVTTTDISDDWGSETTNPVTLNCYSPTNTALSYPLPPQHLTAGNHTLTITATAKDPKATTWYNRYLTPPRQDHAITFALDYIRSIRVPE